MIVIDGARREGGRKTGTGGREGGNRSEGAKVGRRDGREEKRGRDMNRSEER